jgi:hypothetical protein
MAAQRALLTETEMRTGTQPCRASRYVARWDELSVRMLDNPLS